MSTTPKNETVSARVSGPREWTAWWSLVAAVACVAAISFGIHRLIVPGPFDWHIEQPEYLRGVIEFASLWAATLILLLVQSGWVRLASIALVVALYMRMHGTDLALLLGAAYCVGIYGLGILLVPGRGARGGEPAYRFREHALRTAVGLSVMAIVLMSGALVFRWDFEANRIVGLAMACLGLGIVAWRARGLVRSAPDPLHGVDAFSKAALSLLVATAAICIARSNLPFYFDSAWYGLRPDRVLIGPEGFYEHLGLTTLVHYYPKLYELLIAPLQGMGDVSNIIVVGVGGAAVCVLAMLSLASLFKLPARYALVHAALLACYPAVMGTVETPKGDVLAAAFVIFAFVALCRALETRNASLLLDVCIYSLLASTIRLSALPWLGILFIGWLLASVVVACSRRREGGWNWRDLVPFGLVLAAFALTHARTYWLAGVPAITNSGTQARLAAMGFDLIEPVGALTAPGDVRAGMWGGLEMMADIALKAEQYPLHVFKWLGAAWLVYLVVALLRPDRAFAGWRGAVALSAILPFPLLLAFNVWPAGAPGGDGNYFMVPVAVIYVCGAAAIRAFHPLALALLLLCAGAGTGVYLMGTNWEIGTARPEGFTASPFDEAEQVNRYLARAGLDQFAARMTGCDIHTRMIGELRTPESFLLPVRFEPFEELAWNNGGAFRDTARFERLLRSTRTDLVALPADVDAGPEKRRHMVELARSGLERVGSGRPAVKITVDGIDLYGTSDKGVACIRQLAKEQHAGP